MSDAPKSTMAVAAYVIAAILTFGHAAASETECVIKARDVAKCKAGAGLAAGIGWPFYWSWFFAEGLRDE